jgi:hypothetical protein
MLAILVFLILRFFGLLVQLTLPLSIQISLTGGARGDVWRQIIGQRNAPSMTVSIEDHLCQQTCIATNHEMSSEHIQEALIARKVWVV